MYQALYRKWRPRTFDDVVGQKHITETLKNQVMSGRLSHAYLFIGTRGTGKTSCAKILAKAVNCEHPVNGNPCNQCPACRGIDDGTIMDVVEMDAASNNGVDNVRALREEAVFSPAVVRKRVYIVDEVHMLSGSAFNALLKILEEPPAHLMFILATTELNKVPATILSRCQRHSFKRLDIASISGRLAYVAQQEKLDLSPEAAALIARLADGGMRDALSLLDQCSAKPVIGVDDVYSAMGLAGKQSTAQIMKYISSGDTPGSLQLFQQLWQDGKDPSTLLNEISSLMRDVLIKKVAAKNGNELLSGGYDDDTINEFCSVFSAETLINGISGIQSTLAAMKSGHAKTLCELCLIELCEPGLGDSLSQLSMRVSRLEAAAEQGSLAVPVSSAPAHDAPQPRSPALPAAAKQEAAKTPLSEAPFDVPDAPAPSKDFQPAPHPSQAAAAAAAPQPAQDAGGSWDSVMAKLKGRLPVGIMAMLSDPMAVSCCIDGDTLRLMTGSIFASNNINRPDVLAAVGDAAQAALGRRFHVEVSQSSQQPAPKVEQTAQPRDKVDELGKYDIVVFK